MLAYGRPPATPQQYAPFAEALAFARSLNLASQQEWSIWCRSGAAPPAIPCHPDEVYGHAGGHPWQGWAHWLGRASAACPKSPRIPKHGMDKVPIATTLVAGSAGDTGIAWVSGIPPKAHIPGSIAGPPPSDSKPTPPKHTLDNASISAATLETTSVTQALLGGKRPAAPGSRQSDAAPTAKSAAVVFRPFVQALNYVHSLQLTDTDEWKVWCTHGPRPFDIPSCPEIAYMDSGWQGYTHWIGALHGASSPPRKFLPFEEALKVARSLRLSNQREWRDWCKAGNRPANIHTHPETMYKSSGWQGWVHWLGTAESKNATDYLPFVDAANFCRLLGLQTHKEWLEWCKSGTRPANVPYAPHKFYKDTGWLGWGTWLGTGIVRRQMHLPFADALRAVRKIQESQVLRSHRDWVAWCKAGARPANIPAAADKAYKSSGWQGWKHWLGTDAPDQGWTEHAISSADDQQQNRCTQSRASLLPSPCPKRTPQQERQEPQPQQARQKPRESQQLATNKRTKRPHATTAVLRPATSWGNEIFHKVPNTGAAELEHAIAQQNSDVLALANKIDSVFLSTTIFTDGGQLMAPCEPLSEHIAATYGSMIKPPSASALADTIDTMFAAAIAKSSADTKATAKLRQVTTKPPTMQASGCRVPCAPSVFHPGDPLKNQRTETPDSTSTTAAAIAASIDDMFAEALAVQSTPENAAAEKPEAADVQALPKPKPRTPPTETRVPPNSATQQPSVSLPPAAQHRVPRRWSRVDTAPAPTPSHGTSDINGMAHTPHPVNTTPSFDTYPQNLAGAAEMQHAIVQQRSVYRHPHSMVGFEYPHSMVGFEYPHSMGYPAASGMPPYPGLGYSRRPAHMDPYHHPYPVSAPPILPPHAYNYPGPRTNIMWPSMYPGGHP